MRRKITTLLMSAMILAASSQQGFAATNPDTTQNNIPEVPEGITLIQEDGIEEEAVQDAMNYMERLGFDINDISIENSKLVMQSEINDVEQRISFSEATDSCIAMSITEGAKTNKIVFTDDGCMLIDGSEITTNENVVTSTEKQIVGQIKSDRRIVTYRSKPSYGTSADYIKHHTVKRVISFGEKYAYQFTMGAFVLLMGKEMLAAGLITASVSEYTGLALGTFLSGIISYNPYQSAVSLQDVVAYHYKKGLVISPILTISKHTLTFYATKYYTYPTGPARIFYEESSLDVGI
jgi:hypothetical protein